MSCMPMWACCACVKLLSSTALQYILMSLFAIRWLGLWKRWSTKKCAAVTWGETGKWGKVGECDFFSLSRLDYTSWGLTAEGSTMSRKYRPAWGLYTCVCVFWWSVAGENCCLEAEYVRNCRPTESHGYLNKSYSEANAMCTMCNVTFDTPDYTRLTLTQIFLCFCVFLRVNFNLIFKAFSYTTKDQMMLSYKPSMTR